MDGLVFSLSIAVNVATRPNLLVWPTFLWFSDLTQLSLVILWLALVGYTYKDGRTDSAVDQNAWLMVHPVILLALYGGTMYLVAWAFAVNMSESAWFQLLASLSSFPITYYGGFVFTTFFLDHWSHLIEPLSLTPSMQQMLAGTTSYQKRPVVSVPSAQPNPYGQPSGSSVSGYPPQKGQSQPQVSPTTWTVPQTYSRSSAPPRSSSRGSSQSPSRGGLTRPRTSSTRPIGAQTRPCVGDMVQSTVCGQVRLTREITSGGEGTVFETDKGLVCKVYKKEKLNATKKDKLERMLRKQVSMQGVCWPKDIVSYSGEFVGFLMDKAEGKPMQTSMFMKQLLIKNFPHWTRMHLVELSISILNKIVELHKRGILIGDINPLNILIEDEKNVYFVDTDSYQIDQFPCPVGTVNFTAPEIQGKDFKTFLRTPEHENFAVATLTFMILLPGKPPYSQQGGGNPSENIRNGDFSYPLGDQSNRRAPPGPWMYIWSNLPRYIKNAFYEVFKEGKRLSSEEWLHLMTRYQNDFQKGWIHQTSCTPHTSSMWNWLRPSAQFVEKSSRWTSHI